MNVRVQFFSHLKDVVGAAELELSPEQGATAGQLLANLYERYPKLREWDSNILIGAGVEFVERDYVLRSGDEIAIMPPVQGG
jgi:MoaD family protein